MQFLKTLFWVLLAVILVLFASRNWTDATLNLWGDIQVDIKLPVLMLVIFLLGFLPVFLVHRARLWTLKRRLEVEQRQPVLAEPVHPDEASSTL
jgi:putative membrane protein